LTTGRCQSHQHHPPPHDHFIFLKGYISPLFPREKHKNDGAQQTWKTGYRFSENRFRSYLEGRFSGLEKCLAQGTTAAPARPNKPAAEAKTAALVKKSQTAVVEAYFRHPFDLRSGEFIFQ